jgi:diguanylate cyclase (GGDEF)-like protein
MRHGVIVTNGRALNEVPGFQLRPVSALAADAFPDEVECAIVVAGASEQIAAAVRLIDRARGETAVAMVLAGGAKDEAVARALQAHAFDGFIDLAWPPALLKAGLELALRQVELGRNVVEIQRVVIEQSRNETVSLYELAVRDELTKLNNKRHFDEILAREHERSKRLSRPYAIIYVDLDDLKQLNTRLGHAGGSLALRELGRVLASLCRVSDAAARLGGDEFAVLVADTDKVGGCELAQRLISELAGLHIDFEGQDLTISASIGVAAFPEHGAHHWDVLNHADAALLRAKATGKRRAIAYEAAS